MFTLNRVLQHILSAAAFSLVRLGSVRGDLIPEGLVVIPVKLIVPTFTTVHDAIQNHCVRG